MYRNILVAIDDSETSRVALDEAINITRATGAKLHIVHVADEVLLGMHQRTVSTTLNLDHAMAAIRGAGAKILDDARAAASGIDAETILLETMKRRVSEVLVDKSRELGCDLIVIGRHGQRGLARLILGSVAEQVAKIADASVLLVRKH
ncbi:MAG: universal stress protein [Azonexus sp.]|jgi:nucleotide-binding universal stress UspA family protein